MVLSKTVLIFIILAGIMTAANADVYYSLNAGCEGNLLGMGGGSVLNRDNITPLAVGNIVQYIYAGEDGIPNPPGASGRASGDDVLLATKRIGDDNVWMVFKGKPGFFFNGITGKIKKNIGIVKVFVRAWNTARIIRGSYYGNSQLVNAETSKVIVPAPNDTGISNFSTSKVFK